MARVIGIGGVFFRSSDPGATGAWYAENLGIDFGEHGFAVMKWRRESEDVAESTVWSPFPADTEYFGSAAEGAVSGAQDHMVNYIVDDLDEMLSQLRAAGVEVLDKLEEMDGIGRFGWAVDPDGRRIELWEPSR